jgi:hypothetical protein
MSSGGRKIFSYFFNLFSLLTMYSIDGAWSLNSILAVEIIAIMKEERRGFNEMEALALASLFWRRRRQTNSKIDTRQYLGLRKQVSVSCHRLPFPWADAVWRTLSPSLLLRHGIGVLSVHGVPQYTASPPAYGWMRVRCEPSICTISPVCWLK